MLFYSLDFAGNACTSREDGSYEMACETFTVWGMENAAEALMATVKFVRAAREALDFYSGARYASC